MSVLAGFVPLVATRIQDAAGNLLGMGTLEVLPTDGLNKPVNASAGGIGGPIYANQPAIFPVTNGALPSSAQIADTTQTLPANICFRLTVKDTFNNPLLTLTKVQTQANTAFNLDTYQPPPSTPLSIVVTGPQGPPGVMGHFTDAKTGVSGTIVPFDGKALLVPNGFMASMFVAASGSGGLPASVFVQDGRLNVSPIPTSTLLSAPATLVDSVTGALWTLLIVLDGSFIRLEAFAGGVALEAVDNFPFYDTNASGALWQVTIASGRITVSPH